MHKAIFTLPALLMLTSTVMADAPDIFQASRSGNIEDIQAYIAGGGELNTYNGAGYTPIIVAAYHERSAAVALLLEKGADPCKPDVNGKTALMGVAFMGNAEIARMLIDRCDVNVQSAAGQTALMFASLFNRIEVVELLMAKGADPTLRSIDGRSAIDLAESQGNNAMVHLLTEPKRPSLKSD